MNRSLQFSVIAANDEKVDELMNLSMELKDWHCAFWVVHGDNGNVIIMGAVDLARTQ